MRMKHSRVDKEQEEMTLGCVWADRRLDIIVPLHSSFCLSGLCICELLLQLFLQSVLHRKCVGSWSLWAEVSSGSQQQEASNLAAVNVFSYPKYLYFKPFLLNIKSHQNFLWRCAGMHPADNRTHYCNFITYMEPYSNIVNSNHCEMKSKVNVCYTSCCDGETHAECSCVTGWWWFKRWTGEFVRVAAIN